jgi:hypothetical protein
MLFGDQKHLIAICCSKSPFNFVVSLADLKVRRVPVLRDRTLKIPLLRFVSILYSVLVKNILDLALKFRTHS